jgi:holliday junction DNA helicase RuvA
MIYHLKGTLSEKNETFIILDVQGIGYQIFAASTVINNLPTLDSSLKIYIYHHIREDQQVLYGFSTKEDREIFIKLTSVSGVGPKVGIKVLSTLTSAQLTQAIITGDVLELTKVPGIGKKVAERLIIELKDKLPSIEGLSIEPSNATNLNEIQLNTEFTQDLSLALKTLGYHQEEIKRALSKSKIQNSPTPSLEDGIKILLKHL